MGEKCNYLLRKDTEFNTASSGGYALFTLLSTQVPAKTPLKALYHIAHISDV